MRGKKSILRHNLLWRETSGGIDSPSAVSSVNPKRGACAKIKKLSIPAPIPIPAKAGMEGGGRRFSFSELAEETMLGQGEIHYNIRETR